MSPEPQFPEDDPGDGGCLEAAALALLIGSVLVAGVILAIARF